MILNIVFTSIMLVIGIGVIVGSIFFMFWLVSDYLPRWSCCSGKITFKEFKILHSVNENNWLLFDYYVSYKEHSCRAFNYNCRDLYFGLFDTARYVIWNLKREHAENKARQNEEMESVRRSFQNDIDRYNEKEKNAN